MQNLTLKLSFNGQLRRVSTFYDPLIFAEPFALDSQQALARVLHEKIQQTLSSSAKQARTRMPSSSAATLN
jgi:hypothetical protein